jgi:hypothetical protein
MLRAGEHVPEVVRLSLRLFLRNCAERYRKLPLRNRGGPVYRLLRGIVKLVGDFSGSPGKHLVHGFFECPATQFPGIQEVAFRLSVKRGLAARSQGKKGSICPKSEDGTDLLGETVKKN